VTTLVLTILTGIAVFSIASVFLPGAFDIWQVLS
jgi:hypothetical protein